MNIRIFDQEIAASFENNDQFATAYEDLMKQISKAKKQFPLDEVFALWTKLYESETIIDAKMKRLPDYQKLNESIEQQKNMLTKAEDELKLAKGKRVQEMEKLKGIRELFQSHAHDIKPTATVDNIFSMQEFVAMVQKYHEELVKEKISASEKRKIIDRLSPKFKFFGH